MSTLKEKYEIIKSKQLFFIAQIGSQNYNLDEENSDIDAVAVLVPTLEDLTKNQKISYLDIKNDDGEVVHVWDYRHWFHLLEKGNLSSLEILVSKNVIVNPDYQWAWELLVSYRDRIARFNQSGTMSDLRGRYFNQKNKPHRVYEFALFGKRYAEGLSLEEVFRCSPEERELYLRAKHSGENILVDEQWTEYTPSEEPFIPSWFTSLNQSILLQSLR